MNGQAETHLQFLREKPVLLPQFRILQLSISQLILCLIQSELQIDYLCTLDCF